MGKSYIIRIYKQENKSAKGVVEDVEQNKRVGFSNANELWSFITKTMQEHSTGNVIEMEISNATKTMKAIRTSKTY